MSDKPGYGGFFHENIKKWIINECLESGDPDNFFLMVLDVVVEISDEMDTHYWTRLEEE